MHIQTVLATFPLALPGAIDGAPPHFRELIEAQAPARARCAVAYVLPEGFKLIVASGIWTMTDRARRRRDAARSGRLPTTATHRRRPHVAGVDLFATTPPLPAQVGCPECKRINTATATLLASFLPAVADAWATKFAAGGVAGGTAETGSAAPEAAEHEGSGGSAANGTVPPWMQANTLFVTPELLMLSQAGILGWPITPDAFFVIEPDRPYLVASPDPELDPKMFVQVHIPIGPADPRRVG